MQTLVFVPTYEAEQTLPEVIRRIPADIWAECTEILIQDDASTDHTFEVARRLSQQYDKITVVRNDKNLGYGGNKKKAYGYCLDRGYDAVVMVHGDGQLPPESLPAMLAPLRAGTADIVLGSRMLGAPLKGGMPLYKWAGNRCLTALANHALGLRLTDYHTGYRAYMASALSQVHFETCPDGHEISMVLLIRGADAGLRISEVAVPTYYGPGSRSCSLLTSIRYGMNVLQMLHSRRSQGITRSARHAAQ